jgi:7-carboxy-7-deazaguanine synthase
MQVVERLVTLCGETHLAGLPCSLIRFAGCDLECRWCDTRYAVEPVQEPQELSVEELVRWARSRRARLVLLTGGEPLLQADLPELASTLAREHQVLVETSGAHDITALGAPVMRCVDVKSPSSGQSHRMVWDNLRDLREGDAVKFVIASREDYAYALEVIEKHALGRPVNILLSSAYPHLKPAELAAWIVRDLGSVHSLAEVRLNLQLHRVFWPDLEQEVD